MKKENFIKTVISHITDTTRKAEVLAEFNDHLQSKSVYFEELGFEEESAAEKAEQALGDLEQAAIVGEQLGAIKKNKRLPRVLLTLAAIAILLICAWLFLMHEGGTDSFLFFYLVELDAVPQSFSLFIQVFLCWCAWLGLLLLCIRYRVVAGLFLSLPGGVMLSGVVMIYALAAFKAILAGKNAGAFFYYYDFGGYYASQSRLIFGWLMLALITVAPALISAVLAIKKRRLTYNRTDNLLQHIVRIVVLCLLIGSSLFAAALSVAAITQKQVVRERGAHTLALLDDFVLEHTDAILADDKSVARAELQVLLDGAEVTKNLCCKANGICFYTYTKSGNTYFRLYSELQDIGGELIAPQDLEKAKLCDKTNPQNLPKPYALAISESSYGAGEEGIILDVFYDDYSEYASEYDDELLNKVLYRYAEGSGFVYKNSVFSTVGKPYDYDAAHEAALAEALKKKLAHPERYRDFIDCESEIYEKIFAVSFDKTLGQYQADMEVAVDYWTEIDGKVYSVIPESIDIVSVTYKIENDEAVILELWRPDDGDYYEPSIKKRFSDVAFKAWAKTGYADDFNSYEAMYRRIKRYCGKSPYAHIVFIDPATGDCEYYEYTAFGALEKDVKYMRLDK